MGDMADRGGRRPVYVLMFVLMVGANLGIAVVGSWGGLFVLRMVQSAGSSGMFFFRCWSLFVGCGWRSRGDGWLMR